MKDEEIELEDFLVDVCEDTKENLLKEIKLQGAKFKDIAYAAYICDLFKDIMMSYFIDEDTNVENSKYIS